MVCPYCGSEHIKRGITLRNGTAPKTLGLLYWSGIFPKVETIYNDLCMDCGAIVKSYIKGDTEKDWMAE